MSRWAQLKHILACSCQSAAELSSRRMEERLSLADTLALAGHLLVCKSCRHFNRQLAQMRALLAAVATRFEEAGGGENAGEYALSDDARARIAQVLRDAGAE